MLYNFTKKIVSLSVIVIIFLPFFCLAQSEPNFSQNKPLQEAFIKYDKTGWQTYNFYIVTNLKDEQGLSFDWRIDKVETFNSAQVKYFFEKGEHIIQVKVEDRYGNVRNDAVRLDINFWSLRNNWFWWALYAMVILIIIYYWLVKIIYLYNKRKISKQVRYFLDILDEHGWVEKFIEEHHKINK